MFKIPTETLVYLNNVLSKQKHNFFVLPGIEGNCDVFKELGADLEKFDIQLYGLNYSQEVPNDSIESIAKFYLNIINETLKESNSFTLGAYSFGGLIATEMCRQISFDKNMIAKLENLIMFESSHKIFHLASYGGGKQFGLPVSNGDLFKDPTIYCGTLSIYLSTIIGCDVAKRVEMYRYLVDNSPNNLDDAIRIGFDFINKDSLYNFTNDQESIEMKAYLKYFLIKSKAGLKYSYDTNYKLNISIYFFKSNNFFCKKFFNQSIYYIDTSNDRQLIKFQIDSEDFGLKEIIKDPRRLKVIECSGNHWTFLTLSENIREITNVLRSLVNRRKSKL